MKKKDPCWDGYEMVGTKMKNGKKVPNCVPKKKKKKIEESETTSASIPVRNMPAAGEERPRRKKRKIQHIQEMSSSHFKMRKLAREAHKKGKRYFMSPLTSEKQDIYDWIPDLLGPRPKKGMISALKGLFETSEDSLLAAFVEAGEEVLQERKLSDSENKFKKDHVKKLKKHKSNFTDRYGKDGESVMWGVATNLAKKKAK